MPVWLRHGCRVMSGAVLLFALPLMSQTEPAFGFFVVSGSNGDVPAMMQGTTGQEDSLNVQICDELAKGRAAGEIAGELDLKPEELQTHIDALVKAQLLRRDAAGKYLAAFPIIRREDAAWFEGIDRPLIDATARAIEVRQQELRGRFRDALQLNAEQEQELSLVLFGDVLFDRWQTGHVRKEFLQGYPPPRDGKLFFVAALEQAPGNIGSLGIYSHAEAAYGDVKVISYGNTTVIDPFAGEKPERVPELIESYVGFVRGAGTGSRTGSGPATKELEGLGFLRAGKPAVALVTKSEYAKLPEITSSFSEELLRLMNADRPKILDAYKGSPYADAVSFQEFALWWYHFFDAGVVERLIKDGVIAVPPAGYATMVVIPG
jgi:hypothetical protein